MSRSSTSAKAAYAARAWQPAPPAAGHPCKNHAVKGSQLCKAHGGSALDIRHGAPIGNTNAVKHGFYRPTIRQDEYAELLTYAEQFNLADELAVARVRLRRISQYIDHQELLPGNCCNLCLKKITYENYIQLHQMHQG